MTALARYFLCLIVSCGLFTIKAQAALDIPKLTGPVVDSAGLITSQDQRFLEDLLLRFQAQAQIQILTIPSLQDHSIEEFSIAVTDQWKLGDKKKDNGVLLLISAKEKKIRIEVGQGLEGVIPDVIAKRIISDVMVPVFRQGSVSKGVVLGVYQIIHTIDPNFENAANDEKGFSADQEQSLRIKDIAIAVIFIFMFIFLSIFNRRGGGGGFGGGYMGGRGFGGGFGGSGGGGWSGGGGGFSGGGSSGNW